MLVDSKAASSFLPITSLQPKHYQATTHSFSQQESAIPSDFSGFRTLSIVTGGGGSLESKRACSQYSVGKAPAQVTFVKRFYEEIWLLESATVLRPPGTPCIRLRGNSSASYVSQRLEDPAARHIVQGHIVGHLKQLRHSSQSLLPRQHPGLRQAAAAALAHQRRRIAAERLQQRNHRLIGAQQRKTFDGPIPGLLVGVIPMVHQRDKGATRFYASITEYAQHPQRPWARRGLPANALDQVVGTFSTFWQVVAC